MFLKNKKKIVDLLETVSEMVDVLDQLMNKSVAINDCLNALKMIESKIENEEITPNKTAKQLKVVQGMFCELLIEDVDKKNNIIENLKSNISILKELFIEEVQAKINVVFFPYKASMWDSLASIYEAFLEDPNCVVNVVPIPYYQLTNKEAIPVYEGERFALNIPITHYEEYDLEIEQPDIIFIHNIYDNYNTLTQVYQKYFTSNLKKYTDMLVYVPYYLSSFVSHNKGEGFYPYDNPSLRNIDKIVLVNEREKEKALMEGIPLDKILVLGSPKLDGMIVALSSEIDYPKEWREKVKGKTVFLLDTGCLYFANKPFQALEHLIDIFNIPRFIKDTVILWRPHPLTKISISKYIPHFYEYYQDLINSINAGDTLYKGVILDETDSYYPALVAADILISKEGSLLNAYLLTEKKVLYWAEKMPENSLLPDNVFYYMMDRSESWYDLVKKLSVGYDPLAKNRKNIANRVYVNSNGQSGKEIYLSIKSEVLKESFY